MCINGADSSSSRSSNFHRVNTVMERMLSPLGFEVHPFLIDWYNEQVKSNKFKLDYAPGTLAFVVISQPSMFEKAFVPFLRTCWDSHNIQDPIDQCMKHCFGTVREALSDDEVAILHDFDIHPNRRPKVIVQTAGHVAGAVRFYKVEQQNNNWYPVCHHPRWGGWFAIRGVFIFPSLSEPQLPRKEPATVLSDAESRLLLELYNGNWKDGKWREIGNPEQRYSDNQIAYFNTPVPERHTLIPHLGTHQDLNTNQALHTKH